MFFKKKKQVKTSGFISASLKCFEEDIDKVKNGAPIYPFPDNADLYFDVRRIGSHEQQKEMEDIRKAVYGLNPPRVVDNNKLWAHWLGEYGVTGWGYLEDEKGNELKFTRATCRSIFLDESHRNFLVPTLVSGANDGFAYLTEEAIEAIEELKKP